MLGLVYLSEELVSWVSGGAACPDVRLFLGSCWVSWFCSFALEVQVQLALKLSGSSASLRLLVLVQ